MGKELLALAAQKGAAIATFRDPTLKMCHDCAFKTGTDANDDINAVHDAMDCLSFGGTFNCHNDFLEDAGRPCVGFLYAWQYMQSVKEPEDENTDYKK